MAFGALKGALTGNATSIGTSAPINTVASGSAAVLVGDLVYAVFGEQTAPTMTTVVDNLGNTYTATQVATDAGTATARAYYSRVTVAGTISAITATANGGTNNFAGAALIIEGPFQTNPIDRNPTNITSDVTTPFTCPSSTTLTQAAEVVIGWSCSTGSAVWTATSPNLLGAQIATAAILSVRIGYQLVAATTAVAPVFAGTNPTDGVLGTTTFMAAATQALTPGLVTDTDTFYVPTVGRGAVALTPGLMADAGEAFFAPTVAGEATAAILVSYARATPQYRFKKVPSSEVISPPQRGQLQLIVAPLFVDTDTFFAPTFAAGVVNLTPALFNDTDLFFAPTITTGAVDLTPSLFADTDNFSAPTVSAGAVNLTPSLFTDTDTFFSPTGAGGEVAITLALFIDSDAFFAPLVEGGEVAAVDSTIFASYAASEIMRGGRKFVPPMSITVVVRKEVEANALSASLIVDADTVFAPTITLGTVNLSPPLYTDTDEFFTHVLEGGETVDHALTSYSAAEPLRSGRKFIPPMSITVVIKTAFVEDGDQSLIPGLAVDNDTFYAPIVGRGAVAITPALFTDTDTFYAHIVSTGAPTLLPGLVVDADTFFAPTVAAGAVALTPALFTDTDTFYAHIVSTGALTLLPGLVVDDDTFYAPIVGRGAVALTPALFTDTDTFYAHIVSTGALTLLPGLVVDPDTFYAPTIATGAVALTPALFTDADLFYAPTIGRGTVALTPGLVTDADTFFAPIVAVGAASITPALFTDTDTFFAPTIGRGAVSITPPRYADADTFFSPIVEPEGEDAVVPPLYNDADTFHVATVGRGAIALTPALFTDTDVFFAPVVNIIILPGVVVDADSFHTPTVGRGAVNLSPELVVDVDTFYQPFFFQEGAQNVAPELYAEADLFYRPSVRVTTRTPSSGRVQYSTGVQTRSSPGRTPRNNNPHSRRKN